MNLVQERITHLCERLKLTRVAVDWPAIASEAVNQESTYAQFLEHLEVFHEFALKKNTLYLFY